VNFPGDKVRVIIIVPVLGRIEAGSPNVFPSFPISIHDLNQFRERHQFIFERNGSPGGMDQRWMSESGTICVKCFDTIAERALALEQTRPGDRKQASGEEFTIMRLIAETDLSPLHSGRMQKEFLEREKSNEGEKE